MNTKSKTEQVVIANTGMRTVAIPAHGGSITLTGGKAFGPVDKPDLADHIAAALDARGVVFLDPKSKEAKQALKESGAAESSESLARENAALKADLGAANKALGEKDAEIAKLTAALAKADEPANPRGEPGAAGPGSR